MKELFRKGLDAFRNYSIFLIVAGALMVVWPGTTVTILFRILGILLLITGFTGILEAFRSEDPTYRYVACVPAVVVILFGFWFLAAPGFVISIIPVLIGLALLFYGIRGLVFLGAVNGFRVTPVLFTSLASMVIGVILIVHPWTMARILIVVLGILLILTGINGIYTSRKGRSMFDGFGKGSGKGLGSGSGPFGRKSRADRDVIDVDYQEEESHRIDR